jgi:putative tryptophan/tyrosine transport system substrate-binding protein
MSALCHNRTHGLQHDRTVKRVADPPIWSEGRNLQIDYRWGGGDVGRIKVFTKELVDLSPDVIVGHSTPSVVALRQETRSIPIVFLTVTDPVGQGFVASLAHPGGNITGFQVFEFSLGTKWMDTLKQIAPSLRRVATFFNPETAPYYPLYLRTMEKAASSFAVELIAVEVHDDAEIERAISTLAREPGGGLIVFPDSFNEVHRRTIIALVERYRLPAIYYFRYFATDGGLVSAGPCQKRSEAPAAHRIRSARRGDPGSHPLGALRAPRLVAAEAGDPRIRVHEICPRDGRPGDGLGRTLPSCSCERSFLHTTRGGTRGWRGS